MSDDKIIKFVPPDTKFGCDEHADKEWCRCVHYTAPKGGYYSYTIMTTMFKRTGKFERIENPHRRWFEFWKPKIVEIEIIRTIQEPTSRATKYFAEGEVILTCGSEPERVDDPLGPFPT